MSKLEVNGPVFGGVARRDINNHFYGDIARYMAMDSASLREERERLHRERRRAYAAFIRHRTVPWFAASMSLMIAFMVASFWWPKSIPLGLATLACAALFVIPSSIWMVRERRPLYDGLVLWRSQIKAIEACLAVREASPS